MKNLFAKFIPAFFFFFYLLFTVNSQDSLTVVAVDSIADTLLSPDELKRQVSPKPAHSLDLQDDRYKTGNIADQMEGRVSGVQVSNPGSPDSEMLIRLRGIHSIHGHNRPLYVIDGMRIYHIRTVSDLENIVNPNDIKRIEFLKDAFSTSQYGSEGANGVILIETK